MKNKKTTYKFCQRRLLTEKLVKDVTEKVKKMRREKGQNK